MRILAAFVMQGRFQAVLSICGFAVVPPLLWLTLFSRQPVIASLLLSLGGLVSTALFALVVLRKGGVESAWVCLFSALAIGFSSVMATGNALPGMLYGALLWVPVWPIAALLRTTRRMDWATEAGAGLGLVMVLGCYLLIPDPAALWRERFQLRAVAENAPANLSPERVSGFIELISHYVTGIVVASFVVTLLLPLLIARSQQAALFNPGGFATEFGALRMHRAMAYAALGCVAMGLSSGGWWAELAWNLSSVFFVLFAVAGFSVLYALFGGKGFWAAISLGLLLVPQFLLPPIVFLGLSDVWLDWRKYSKRTRSAE